MLTCIIVIYLIYDHYSISRHAAVDVVRSMVCSLVLTTNMWGRVMQSGWRRRFMCINAVTVPPGSTLS